MLKKVNVVLLTIVILIISVACTSQETSVDDTDPEEVVQEEKIMDNETLIDEVAEIAYDKAVEVVTEKVRVQTQEEDIRILDQLCNSIVQNPNNSDKAKTITKNVIKMAKDKLRNATKAVIAKVQKNLQEPEVRKTNTEQIKKKTRTSILEKLAANKKRIVEDAANKKNKTKYHDRNFL